jgi:hypothetical protein
VTTSTATATLPRLDAFLADRKALSKEAFLAKHTASALIISASAQGAQLEDAGGFHTQVLPSGTDRYGIPVASQISVAFVVKRMADAFQNFIWVGRESRCDVVLPFESISKLQAQFLKKASGELDLLDPGSTNGTFLEGARLEKNKAAPVRDGMGIRFGRVSCRFRTAEGFWEELGRFV